MSLAVEHVNNNLVAVWKLRRTRTPAPLTIHSSHDPVEHLLPKSVQFDLHHLLK